ncbi:ribulokinase [Paenibacillus senegalensis]|uniref:ribulokinase n=1 Tax=Paenibacillus senegalensis TaxID=1465766 RepID=UPI000287CC7A|nr:ribulokinase [Paenibacillus senegalensis]
MSKRYALGIDFGTESGRAVLVDLSNGEEVAQHVTPYRHGVMDSELPSGQKLAKDWALQHPADYLEVLTESVPEAVRQSGISAEQIVGIGIDFTSCTMLPVDAGGTPLCMLDSMRENPHSWVKLWKHHAAAKHAQWIDEAAAASGQRFPRRYGNKQSSEWMLAKIWQVLDESPELFEKADLFVEAADWVVYKLTGELKRNSCTAGYKAIWHKREGYPDESFFAQLDPRLADLPQTKLRGEVVPLGSRVGELSPAMAKSMGLPPGIPVAAGIIDAHAAVPAAGVVTPGKLVMAMGTSVCHLLLAEKEVEVEGMCGVVEDGIIPGLYGYESGQAATGDTFAWFVEHSIPEYVKQEARSEGVSVHALLERKASRYAPGETGLLALDWWNGNRSVLSNMHLSGLIMGFTLQTKPEELYRTLLEATAFGTRKIIESFERAGLQVNELYATGGLPQRNQLLMQIYADVVGKEIKVAASTYTPAVGAAMFGAVAAGSGRGGYDDIVTAASHMARLQEKTYKPIAEHKIIYDQLYQQYSELHDYFGRGGSQAMPMLKGMRK